MIALGILASAISVAMFMVQQSKSSQSLNGFMLRMQSVRYSLTMAIQNDQAWTATVNSAGNFSFKCIRDLSSCRNAGGSFDLLDPTGLKDIYDGRSLTSGFAPDGTLCSTFDSPVRNPKCPLHLNLSWSPICPPAPDLCLNPTVQINGDFVYSSSNKGTSMNWKMFAFEFLRQKIFCAADPVPFNLSIESGPVTTSPNSVTSTSTAMIIQPGLASRQLWNLADLAQRSSNIQTPTLAGRSYPMLPIRRAFALSRKGSHRRRPLVFLSGT